MVYIFSRFKIFCSLPSIINFLITFHIYQEKIFQKNFCYFFINNNYFNLSKNIDRILNKDNIYFGIDKVNNKYIRLSNINSKSLNVYKPDIKKNYQNGWQGRLCWDIPFLCTYNEISVEKKYGYLFVNKLKN